MLRLDTPSRNGVGAVFFTVLLLVGIGVPSASAMVQLPVRVFSYTAEPMTETVSVNVPAGANAAEWLYAQIHNIRFGGQVSVQVNDGEWTTLYNHTVSVFEPEASQGGIGGINNTVRVAVPLSAGEVTAGQANTVSFRLNGTDGVVSAIRVVAFNFRDSGFVDILPAGEFTEEDPSAWTPPRPDQADIDAGENLWWHGAILNDPINQVAINAKCSSCHFADGSDLKYFNFSNDSIVTRSLFHGLTQEQGEQIASYIRANAGPSPGRPWNPPFQPGPNLDPDPGDSALVRAQKAESWMAGAGLDWVVESEAEILSHVFPNGTSRAEVGKVMDHEGTFSVREIPIPIQFPDWNTWLPDFAPEDMWPTAFYYDQPYAFYNTMRDTVDTQGAAALAAAGDLNETFRVFKSDLEDWYGTFRLPNQDLANDTAVSLARNAPLTREDVIKSLMRWMVVKMMEVMRDYDLEAVQDSVAAMQAKGHPLFTPELLSTPGGENRSIVFGLAPHISGNVYVNFEYQPEHLGKMESNQWYHLQLCMNSGYRMQVNMNVPLDWAYQVIHLESAGERAGRAYGFQRLITQIKMLQIRETGKGIQQGGFSQRTLNPCFFYSTPNRDRSLLAGALDEVEAGLWAKVFEEYLYEWLDVVESHNLNTMPRDDADRHQFETSSYVPVPWPGGSDKFFARPGEVHADALYRLLPLLPPEGIDELLLTDILEWCKRAWPYNAGTWGATPGWDTLFSATNLYAENFEDGASDFSGLSTTAIKDADYVNTYVIGPRNGGGEFVAQRGLTSGGTTPTVRQGINSTLSVPVGGATRLKLKARVAFRDNDGSDPGTVNFRMRAQFDGSGPTIEAEDTLAMDTELFDTEFESYVSHVDVPAGATNLTWLGLWWERSGGTGAGTVYVDNVHVLPVDETPDTTPPGAPVLASISTNANLRLRCNWSDTNPPADGVVGYHVYRRVDGEPASAAVRVNTGLVDNPYIRFQDYSVDREVTYRYYLTAVDGAGNESLPSNERTRSLNDIDTPRVPGVLWANSVAGSVDVGWFGVGDWDIAGYDVYRKAAGEPGFSRLTTVAEPAEANYFEDLTAVDGVSYDYYVEAFDLVGKLSGPSAVFTILSASGVTYVGAWKVGFNGSNGWDSSNGAVSGNNVDYDRDGVRTLWEYLHGGDPSAGDSDGDSFPSLALVDVSGSDYLQASYMRQEDLPPGVVVKLQGSNDLVTWPGEFVVEGDTPSAGIVITVGTASGGTRTISVRQDVPIGGVGHYPFLRFVLEEE
ncbi:MAG: hypothetical protein AAGD22_00730 [Verrucomicrobiota bacterium]